MNYCAAPHNSQRPFCSTKTLPCLRLQRETTQGLSDAKVLCLFVRHRPVRRRRAVHAILIFFLYSLVRSLAARQLCARAGRLYIDVPDTKKEADGNAEAAAFDLDLHRGRPYSAHLPSTCSTTGRPTTALGRVTYYISLFVLVLCRKFKSSDNVESTHVHVLI